MGIFHLDNILLFKSPPKTYQYGVVFYGFDI